MNLAFTARNLANQTFQVGQPVRHSDGWEGTIIAIEYPEGRGPVRLYVNPADLSQVPARSCYPLNEAAAKRSGKSHFVRSLDHGETMGNFEPLRPASMVSSFVFKWALTRNGKVWVIESSAPNEAHAKEIIEQRLAGETLADWQRLA